MQNLISFFGIFFFIGCAWLLSENRRAFPWRVVGWGLALQFTFAALVLWWEPGSRFFLQLNDVFTALLAFSREGTMFVFGSLGTDISGANPISLRDFLTRLAADSSDPVIQQAIANGTVPGFVLALQVLTTIIFFSALLSVLYYYGIMQKVVDLFARIMAKTMRLSGAEALSNSANIFVGQTEAPLVVRPFIATMTRSELMAIMVGGFANTAGGVLGAYVLMLSGYFPNIAAHLISASVLSAPAAFIMAKIMVPEREQPKTMGTVTMDVPIEDANVLDAAANGSTVGWQLAINVTAMLMAFLALLAMVNMFIGWAGGLFHDGFGLLRFNLLALAALASVIAVQRVGPPRDTTVWLALPVVLVVAAVAGSLLSAAAAAVLIGVVVVVWLTAFMLMGRTAPLPRHLITTLAGGVMVADALFLAFGPLPTGASLSLQMILGWLHWPVAFAMGTPVQDCYQVGRLLGEKLVLTEFVAYADLGAYLGAAGRGEVPALDPRSIVVVSYALSGFSNFASIAIQIGGISPMAPTRRKDIASLGLKAMIGGALASYALASVAGVFYNGTSMLGGR
jgi:CNT family concentrative nucleoside transporter